MEFACRGRPTTAAADDGRHGFPDPHPPPHGPADLAPEDAALVRRREELLRELHEERIRQDMILRELAETERAIAARFALAGRWPLPVALPRSQDYWHCRPSSVPLLDEAPLRPPRASTDHPPCYCGSPAAAARAPLVYPHVERSLTPTPRPRPADDGEQQQECRSPGARADPVFSGYAELSRSLRKRTLAEEALVPAAANDGARPTLPASIGEEVAPAHRPAVGGEPKADAEDGHGLQPLYERGSQSSGQRKAAESAMVPRTDEPVLPPRQYGPAGQEKAAIVEQKRKEFSEPTPQAEGASSGAKRKLTAATSPVTKKQKPLGEWSRTLCHVNPTCQRNLDEHLAGRLHQSNLAVLQSTTNKAPELNTKATPEWNKSSVNNSESLQRDGDGGSQRLGLGEKLRGENSNEPPPATSKWTCRMCQARCTSELDFEKHLAGSRHRENREALPEKFRSFCDRKQGAETAAAGRKGAYFCGVCVVRCNSEKMLASHLRGQRHRMMQEGRH